MSDPELQKLADDCAVKCLDYVAMGKNNASQSVAVSFSQHILAALNKVKSAPLPRMSAPAAQNHQDHNVTPANSQC